MTTATGLAVDRIDVKLGLVAVASALAVGAALGAFGPWVAGALLAATGVVVFAALAPEKALLLLPLAIYIPVRETLSATVNMTLADALLGLIALGWVLWVWRRRSLELDRDPIFVLLLLFIAAPVLSMLNSPSRALTAVGILRAFELWGLLFAITLSVVRRPRDVRWLIGGYVALTSLEALVGLYQFVAQRGAFVNGVYARAVGTASLYSWLDFALALGMAVILLAGDLLVRRRTEAWRWGVLVVLVAAVMATYTRGVWVGIIVAVAFMVLVSRPRVLLALTIATGLFFGAILSDPSSPLAERVISMTDPTDSSVVQRLYLWETAAAMFASEPIVGVGSKTFPRLRDRYAVPGLEIYSYHDTPGASLKVELLSPHNYYLLVAAELGLVGLFAFVTLLLALLARGVRVARHAKDPALSSAALGLMGVLVFLAVHACIGDVFTGSIGLAAAFFMALLAAVEQVFTRCAPECRALPAGAWRELIGGWPASSMRRAAGRRAAGRRAAGAS